MRKAFVLQEISLIRQKYFSITPSWSKGIIKRHLVRSGRTRTLWIKSHRSNSLAQHSSVLVAGHFGPRYSHLRQAAWPLNRVSIPASFYRPPIHMLSKVYAFFCPHGGLRTIHQHSSFKQAVSFGKCYSCSSWVAMVCLAAMAWCNFHASFFIFCHFLDLYMFCDTSRANYKVGGWQAQRNCRIHIPACQSPQSLPSPTHPKFRLTQRHSRFCTPPNNVTAWEDFIHGSVTSIGECIFFFLFLPLRLHVLLFLLLLLLLPSEQRTIPSKSSETPSNAESAA